MQEAPTEVPHTSEPLPELLVQHGPGEELGPLRRDTMQPLSSSIAILRMGGWPANRHSAHAADRQGTGRGRVCAGWALLEKQHHADEDCVPDRGWNGRVTVRLPSDWFSQIGAGKPSLPGALLPSGEASVGRPAPAWRTWRNCCSASARRSTWRSVSGTNTRIVGSRVTRPPRRRSAETTRTGNRLRR
jgi:hypothetical protein